QPERQVHLRLRKQLHRMNPRRAAPYAFIEAPLDRAENLRDDNATLARLWADGRALVIDGDGRARADARGGLLAVRAAELGAGPGDALFLGLRGEEGWFAVREESLADADAGTSSAGTDAARVDLRTAA